MTKQLKSCLLFTIALICFVNTLFSLTTVAHLIENDVVTSVANIEQCPTSGYIAYQDQHTDSDEACATCHSHTHFHFFSIDTHLISEPFPLFSLYHYPTDSIITMTPTEVLLGTHIGDIFKPPKTAS